MEKMMERRHFLITAGAIGASAGLAGCGFFSTDPDSGDGGAVAGDDDREAPSLRDQVEAGELPPLDRKSTRLNSSHVAISYAVFCLKKKKKTEEKTEDI